MYENYYKLRMSSVWPALGSPVKLDATDGTIVACNPHDTPIGILTAISADGTGTVLMQFAKTGVTVGEARGARMNPGALGTAYNQRMDRMASEIARMSDDIYRQAYELAKSASYEAAAQAQREFAKRAVERTDRAIALFEEGNK